jgi:6-phosphogluconate dehydrogenase
MNMKIGLIGLGKMGGNMRQRLRNKGIEVVGYARSTESNPDVDSIKALVEALPTPRIVWVMVPHGKPTDAVIDELEQYLDSGDLIIEGGNSRFSDDARHAAQIAPKGIGYIDCGVSGGVWGLENGYGLMVGGDAALVEKAMPIFDALRPEGNREEGFRSRG